MYSIKVRITHNKKQVLADFVVDAIGNWDAAKRVAEELRDRTYYRSAAVVRVIDSVLELQGYPLDVEIDYYISA